MSDAAIELEDVWVSLGGRPVLEAIHLEVPRRDYLAIIGPNGSGKSTLLKVMLGLLRPDHGRVRMLGTTPTRARGRLGYVPQHAGFEFDFPIRVLDVVRMGRLGRRRLVRPLGREDRVRAVEALGRVGMADRGDRPISELSGGERERVLIARALVVEPEILLLDEPTASLDVQTAESFYGLLAELAEHMTVVLVSHDIGTVSRRVQSVACLNRRMVVHSARELTAEMVEQVYGCPIDLLAHGHPHRVLADHGGDG